MNQMSRPQSASRLSEDIGDVLGAIRRLIAEDEAMDYDRSDAATTPALSARTDPPADPASGLAERFGGAAALARRMVQDSANLRDRMPVEEPTVTRGAGRSDAGLRTPLIADRQIPRARASAADIVALRDAPVRRHAIPTASPSAEEPLRLGAADRVISVILEDDAFDDAPAGDAAARLGPTPYTSFSAINGAADRSEEPDDFAEAFDAKARMRPDVTGAVGYKRASKLSLPVDITDDQPERALPQQAADPFWQAYAAHDPESDSPEVGAAVQDRPLTDEGGSSADEARFPAAIKASAAGMVADDDGAAADRPSDASFEAEAHGPQHADGFVTMAEDAIADMAAIDEAADEASVRAVIREIIQEELHGELGQRFSRNLRAVIRREVAASIDEHLERL